jgi:hypothetical protein
MQYKDDAEKPKEISIKGVQEKYKSFQGYEYNLYHVNKQK